MMKNTFYFILKALFVLKIFKFLKKRLDWKDAVNFKIHDATTWLTNNYNTHFSTPHFVYDFLRKMFLMLNLLTDQISLSDCLYFLRYGEICVL